MSNIITRIQFKKGLLKMLFQHRICFVIILSSIVVLLLLPAKCNAKSKLKKLGSNCVAKDVECNKGLICCSFNVTMKTKCLECCHDEDCRDSKICWYFFFYFRREILFIKSRKNLNPKFLK